MTKVSTLMGFVTFLVVGVTSSGSSSFADRGIWMQQCTQETGFRPPASSGQTIVTDREEWCFWACYQRKEGLMKDGKLVEREKACDILVDMSSGLRLELKDGKTIRQLAEQCYDEANLKTEVCEVAGALVNCMRQGIKSVQFI